MLDSSRPRTVLGGVALTGRNRAKAKARLNSLTSTSRLAESCGAMIVGISIKDAYPAAGKRRDRIVLLDPVSELRVFTYAIPMNAAGIYPFFLNFLVLLELHRVVLKMFAVLRADEPCRAMLSTTSSI